MKPSRLSFILLTFSIVFILSMCSDLLIVRREMKKDNSVSLSDAEKDVIELLNVIDAGKTKAEGGQRSIKEKFSIGSITKGSSDPVYHVFNFSDNKGYAIASADKRTVPVFCIIDDGNINTLQDNDDPDFQSVFLYIDLYYRLKTGAKVYDLNGVEIDPQTVREVYGYMLDGEGEGEEEEDTIECFYTENPYVEYQAWQVKERAGSILPTKWGQGKKFKKFCQTPSGQSAPVGCVPLAVGQIMAYHKKNITYNSHVYNWSVLENIIDTTSCPNDTITWNSVALLLSDIGRPENLNVDYHSTWSAVYNYQIPADIYQTFANFGYQHTGSYHLYHSDESLQNLLFYGPILIFGATVNQEGHAWVIDEEVTRRRRVRYNYQLSDYTEVYQEDRVIHMNLVVYGYANGYYHPDCFDIGAGPINFRTDSTSGTTLNYNFAQSLYYISDIY